MNSKVAKLRKEQEDILLLDEISSTSFLNAYPLPTIIFDSQEQFIYANSSFFKVCQVKDFNCTSIESFLNAIIEDDAQRMQCRAMLSGIFAKGEVQWSPIVFKQGISSLFGALQAWEYNFNQKKFLVVHLLLQPEVAVEKDLSFDPDSGFPEIPSTGGLAYFSNVVHAAYNLWLLLDRLPCGVVLFDDKQRIIGVNKLIKDSYGYTCVHCDTLNNWWELVHSRPYGNEVMKFVEEGKTEFGPVEATIVCQDGAKRSVLLELVAMSGGWSSIIYENLFPEISDENNLQKLKNELYSKKEKIRDLQISMRTLLEMRSSDKKELEEIFRLNLNNLILPHLDRLYRLCSNDIQRKIVDLIKSNIEGIASPAVPAINPENNSLLTPRELQIANMLAKDMNSKDIAESLCISESSVGYYRNILRRKLGLIDQKVNLKAALCMHISSQNKNS